MKICRILSVTMIILIFTSVLASAQTSPTYTFNEWGEPVEVPSAYDVAEIIYKITDDISVNNPTDMFVAEDDKIYILDNKNDTGRVIVLKDDFSLFKVIDTFSYNNEPSPVNKDAGGIFVDKQGRIYIADTSGERIIECNEDGEISKEFKVPESPIYPKEIIFKPTKVLKDSSGNVYALVKGLYLGAVTYNPNGSFQGFYGTNNVAVTPKILMDYFWKKIMTKSMTEGMARYVPVSYTNIFISEDDFVFCTTEKELRKLNPGGKNVMETQEVWGDIKIEWEQGKPIETKFSDVTVNKDGIISLLDITRGKIFSYTAEGQLIFAFGANGSKQGTFSSAISLESMGNKLLVLDGKKNSLTVFSPTPFATAVHQALNLYNQSNYAESQKKWSDVLGMDSNYDLAYTGLGKAEYILGNYEDAMKYFKLSGSRERYSMAKKEQRLVNSKEHFGTIATVIVILAILISLFFIRRLILRKKGKRHNKGGSANV